MGSGINLLSDKLFNLIIGGVLSQRWKGNPASWLFQEALKAVTLTVLNLSSDHNKNEAGMKDNIFSFRHSNRNAVILTKFSLMAALEVVGMTTSSATSDENVVNAFSLPLSKWLHCDFKQTFRPSQQLLKSCSPTGNLTTEILLPYPGALVKSPHPPTPAQNVYQEPWSVWINEDIW